MANDPTNDANNLEKQSEVQQTQKELLADIKASLVAQSDSVGSSLGRDTINVRRHLLEMKKMNSEQLDNLAAMNAGFGFQIEQDEKDKESEGVQKQNELESKSDMMSVFQEISETLKNQPDALAKSGAKESSGIIGDVFGGFGKMAGGLGIGIGAAGVGAGAVIGAGAYLLSVLDDIDGEKIKENVAQLLTISDITDGSKTDLLKESGTFYLSMLGLGLGLAAFSLGAGAAMAITKFEVEGWPENIKANVLTLLSIADSGGGNLEVLKDSGTLFLALAGLGLGLAAFGIGSAAEGVGGAIAKFASGENWAEDVKSEVLTLLSIADGGGGNLEVLKDSGTLFLALAGLGLGLAAFAFGKAASGVGDAVTKFQGENFAEDIKSEVATLLTISDLPGAQLGEGGIKNFIGVMGGLGLGLLAFGAGKGIAGVADITTQFAGQNFAVDIKKEVGTLLEIPDLLGDPETTLKKAQLTTGVLGEISKGLAAFGAGKFIAGLGQAMESAVGFFTGTDSPVVEALKIGENSEQILKGVDALDKFKGVLDTFSGMGDLDFEFDTAGLAEDLLKASNIFEIAFEGGTDYRGYNTEYKGFVNIEGIDEGIEEINKIKEALFSIPSGVGVEINANSLADQIAERLVQTSSNTLLDTSSADTLNHTTTTIVTGGTSAATATVGALTRS